MKHWIKVRGVARVFEENGVLYVRFPKAQVKIFGLQSGDVVRWRKRREKQEWLVTFWRRAKQLFPKSKI